MSAAGYEANVADDIKTKNLENLNGYKKKAADIEEAIANFKHLEELEKSS